MGKEIQAIEPKTQHKIIYRFIEKDIFIKANNLQYVAQLIQQIQSKGGSVEQGRNWIKCNIYGKNTLVKLGEYEIDLDKDSISKIEDKCCNFFLSYLKKGGFKCKVKDL